MFFERWIKWITPEASSRAGLLSVPTALVVDGSRRIVAPEPISLEDWLCRERAKVTPLGAVGFLQISRAWTIATVVDLTRRTIAARIIFATKELGAFSDVFLAGHDGTERHARSLLPAPKWFEDHALRTALMALAPTDLAPSDPGTTSGVRPDGKPPPEPPKLQALVALAEETSSLQGLPVVSGAPLDP
jgi:hypothetical protein